MKLFGLKLSPFVMRPLLVARAKGHEIDTVVPDGGLKGPDYLALNPIGKVPTLVDGDFCLPESQVIAEYLDAVLDGPPMVAAEPKTAARQRLICRLADVYVVPELMGLFAAREKPEGLPATLERLGVALGHVEHFRDAADGFAVGDCFSIADATLIPMFFFFDALGQLAVVAPHPGLAAWWDRARTSDLGARCIAEQGAGLKAMMAQRAAA